MRSGIPSYEWHSLGGQVNEWHSLGGQVIPAWSQRPARTGAVVRMVEAIDRQRDQVGQIFRVSLDQPLAADTSIFASRGSDATAELSQADQYGSDLARQN